MRNPCDIEINGTTLDVIIDKHDAYLNNKEGGEQANLRSADLRSADLRSANLSSADLSYADCLDDAQLWGATGDLAHLKSIFCDIYQVAYTANVMQIGCEKHQLQDWWQFSDESIIQMDGKKALKFWRKWKPVLQQIIELSPALATTPKTEEQEPAKEIG